MQFDLASMDGGVVVRFAGKLDFTSTGGFEELIRQMREIRPHQLTLDVSGVTWMDSVGLGQLFLLRDAVPALRVRVSKPTPPIRELLILTKANAVFDIE